MNPLAQIFQQINPPERREFATITGERGNGAFSAKTRAGVAIILYGDAKTGQNVWYDGHSGRILGSAPAVTFFDVVLK